MTKTFCDKCGTEASRSYLDVGLKFGERKRFQLRAIFELIEEPAPCGSLGLSSARTSPADICSSCQLELVELLKQKLKTSQKP